ncbi:MAG TPA: hypothetical protein VK699_16020 [Terriglobales bacterium]|jgi:hypothetical protein|nr:hypothetical protein [Terriglobales bacterium]
MAKRIFQRLILFVLAAWMAAPLSADIKIKTKRETMGRASEDTVYIKGPRERTEMGAMMSMNVNVNIINILQCDKNRSIQLNPVNKTYVITPLATEESSTTDSAQPNNSPPAKSKTRNKDTRHGGVVTINVSSSDTGERKKMFGYNARHVTSSISMDASPDACALGDYKVEDDGWYADLSPTLVCRTRVRFGGIAERAGCQDSYRFHGSGFANTGYPLKQTSTIQNGSDNFTTSVEVTDLSTATIDPGLFEIPDGYTEARSYSDLIGNISMASILGAAVNGQEGAETSTPTTSSTKLPRKDPDIDRIGVPLVKKETSEKIDPEQARQFLIQTLKNAGLDPVPVDGKTPAELAADARSKDCDYILYTDVTSVKGRSAGAKVGGFFGVGSGKPATFDVSLAYQLKTPGESKTLLDSTEEVRAGATPGQGIGWALEGAVRATLNYIRQQ